MMCKRFLVEVNRTIRPFGISISLGSRSYWTRSREMFSRAKATMAGPMDSVRRSRGEGKGSIYLIWRLVVARVKAEVEV